MSNAEDTFDYGQALREAMLYVNDSQGLRSFQQKAAYLFSQEMLSYNLLMAILRLKVPAITNEAGSEGAKLRALPHLNSYYADTWRMSVSTWSAVHAEELDDLDWPEDESKLRGRYRQAKATARDRNIQ